MAIGFAQADRRKVSCRNLRETGTRGQKAGQGERGVMVQFSGVPKDWGGLEWANGLCGGVAACVCVCVLLERG